MIKDYVIYEDTDSLYIDINQFIIDNISDASKWLSMSDDNKIQYIQRISKIVENYVNHRVYNEVQKGTYNSIEEEFRIKYEPEKIAKTGLFIKKKKYATYTILDEGIKKDDISVTGLEIIRSDTPVVFKSGLTEILSMILKNYSDEEIKSKANEYKKKAKKLEPEELSSNIGVNNLHKYILNDNSCIKGTPWHIRGVANYRKLLRILGIEEEYPEIEEGTKAKIIYIKQNPYSVDSISYYKWPKEFNKFGIVPDYDKMIDKFFMNKVRYLLSPMGKEEIVSKKGENLNLFFG